MSPFYFNPFTGNFDYSELTDVTPFERLDGTNQPQTGAKTIQYASPVDYNFKDSTNLDSDYHILRRTSAKNFILIRAITSLGCFQGNGSSFKVDYGAAGNTSVSNTFTVTGWINPVAVPDSAMVGRGSNGWYVRMGYSGRINLLSSFREDFAHSNTAVTTGVWNFWAVSVDASGNVKFYLAGVPDGTGSTGGRAMDGGPLVIGADNDTAWSPNKLDDIRFYSRVLSDAEILAMYSGTDPSSTGLQFWAKLNEGSGVSSVDSSSNAYNGTAVAGSLISTDNYPYDTATPVLSEVWRDDILGFFNLNKDLILNKTTVPSKIYDDGDAPTSRAYTVLTAKDANKAYTVKFMPSFATDILGTVSMEFLSNNSANCSRFLLLKTNSAWTLSSDIKGTATGVPWTFRSGTADWTTLPDLLTISDVANILGTGTASFCPLRFVSGPVLTSAVAGSIEFLTDRWYGTITTGTARKIFTMDEGLTSGRLPFATTNGRLADVAGITCDGTFLKLLSDSIKMFFGAGSDMTIWYDGTDGNIKTSDVAPSDLHIQCGTDKTVVLDETVFKDLWVSVDATRVVGTTSTVMIGNIRELVFSNNDTADFPSVELQHDYKEGTDIYFHLHIATRGTNASAYNVRYTLEYSWADIDSVFPATTTLDFETTIAGGTTAVTHKYFALGTVSGVGKHIGSQLKYQLKKIAAASNDAPAANNPFVLQVGIHYEQDTMGSRQQGIK